MFTGKASNLLGATYVDEETGNLKTVTGKTLEENCADMKKGASDYENGELFAGIRNNYERKHDGDKGDKIKEMQDKYS